MARSTSGITISMTCSTISTVTPVVAHLAHQLDAALCFERRQAGQHLVEQQQLRFGRERPRDFEPAFLGRNQIARQRIGAVRKPGELQNLVSLAARLAHHGGADQRADDDVVDHAHGLEAVHDLEGARDAARAPCGRRQRA